MTDVFSKEVYAKKLLKIYIAALCQLLTKTNSKFSNPSSSDDCQPMYKM